MPCFAVATAQALIDDALFSKFLTPDILRQLIDLVSQETGLEIRRTDYTHRNWVSDIRLVSGGMLGVAILDNGKIAVSLGGVNYAGSDTPKAREFMQALETKIKVVGAALLTQAVGQIVQSQGAQNLQTSYKADGTAVLTFQA